MIRTCEPPRGRSPVRGTCMHLHGNILYTTPPPLPLKAVHATKCFSFKKLTYAKKMEIFFIYFSPDVRAIEKRANVWLVAGGTYLRPTNGRAALPGAVSRVQSSEFRGLTSKTTANRLSRPFKPCLASSRKQSCENWPRDVSEQRCTGCSEATRLIQIAGSQPSLYSEAWFWTLTLDLVWTLRAILGWRRIASISWGRPNPSTTCSDVVSQWRRPLQQR